MGFDYLRHSGRLDYENFRNRLCASRWRTSLQIQTSTNLVDMPVLYSPDEIYLDSLYTQNFVSGPEIILKTATAYYTMAHFLRGSKYCTCPFFNGIQRMAQHVKKEFFFCKRSTITKALNNSYSVWSGKIFKSLQKR